MKINGHIRGMTLTALMCAMLCVAAPLSIPIGAVPISLATFVVMLSCYVAGTKRAVCSVILYLCLGAAGLPVFSGFEGGIGKLVGPTGGYLAGYILLALISGAFIDLARGRKALELVGMLTGTVVLYAFGSAWLAVQMKITFADALLAGVLPFIPGDLLKTAAAQLVGSLVKERLKRIARGAGNGDLIGK